MMIIEHTFKSGNLRLYQMNSALMQQKYESGTLYYRRIAVATVGKHLLVVVILWCCALELWRATSGRAG